MLILNELFKVLSERAILFLFPNRNILFMKGESKKDVAPSHYPSILRNPLIKNFNRPSNIVHAGNDRGHSGPPDQKIK